MIESTTFDVDVINGMKEGASTMAQMNKQLDVDQLEELKDDLADQQADMEDRQNFFAEAAQGEDDEDLLAQLDEYEADAVGAEIEGMEVGTAGIANPNPNPVPATSQAEEEAQKELDELERMMAA